MTRATIELISQKFFVCKAQELSMRVEREREREREKWVWNTRCVAKMVHKDERFSFLYLQSQCSRDCHVTNSVRLLLLKVVNDQIKFLEFNETWLRKKTINHNVEIYYKVNGKNDYFKKWWNLLIKYFLIFKEVMNNNWSVIIYYSLSD